MLRKTTLKKINDWIDAGFERRSEEASQECCDYFLKAWETLAQNAPKKYKDFNLLIEKYNEGKDHHDWSGWIWEVVEELGIAGTQRKQCLEHRIEFIEAFQKRFPETSDAELMEYLQRSLIKTHFLLDNEEAGEAAVKNFYEKFDYSVWGYIEWGDAILKKSKKPSKKSYEKAIGIYQRGLKLKDDAEFLAILEARIEKAKKLI